MTLFKNKYVNDEQCTKSRINKFTLRSLSMAECKSSGSPSSSPPVMKTKKITTTLLVTVE